MLRQRLVLPVFLGFLLLVVLFVITVPEVERHTTLLVVAALGVLVTGHVLRRGLRERLVYRRDGEEVGARTRQVTRAGVVETGMLEPSELRRWREIEHRLRTDDPGFVARLGARPGARRDGGVPRQLRVLVVLGSVLALVGFVAPVFFALGLSLALTAVAVRSATAWLDRRHLAPADQDDPARRSGDDDSAERQA